MAMFTSKEAKSGRRIALLPGFNRTSNMIIMAITVAAKHLRTINGNESLLAKEL
jgi:hypothetical protein